MTLDARRIALKGIGYGALAVALKGFVPIEVTDIPVTINDGFGPPQRQIYVPSSRAHLDDEELMLIVLAALHVITL